MNTNKTVSFPIVLAAILLASTAQAFSASVCGGNADASMHAACCARTDAAAQPRRDRDQAAATAAPPPLALANWPALTLADDTERQSTNLVAAEATSLRTAGSQTLPMSSDSLMLRSGALISAEAKQRVSHSHSVVRSTANYPPKGSRAAKLANGRTSMPQPSAAGPAARAGRVVKPAGNRKVCGSLAGAGDAGSPARAKPT